MNDLNLCLDFVRWIIASHSPIEYLGNRYEMLDFNGPPAGNGLWRTEWSRDRWRYVILKGQTRSWSQYA